MRGWLTEKVKDYRCLDFKYYDFEEWIFCAVRFGFTYYVSVNKTKKQKQLNWQKISYISIHRVHQLCFWWQLPRFSKLQRSFISFRKMQERLQKQLNWQKISYISIHIVHQLCFWWQLPRFSKLQRSFISFHKMQESFYIILHAGSLKFVNFVKNDASVHEKFVAISTRLLIKQWQRRHR